MAYKSVMYKKAKKEHPFYADSIVATAKRNVNNIIIGLAYTTKATVCYGRKEYNKALDNFILANKYISKTKDSYSSFKVKYGITQTKFYLGFHDEAIALFIECLEYFK